MTPLVLLTSLSVCCLGKQGCAATAKLCGSKTWHIACCRDRISLNNLANESTFKLLDGVVQMGVNLQEVLHKAVSLHTPPYQAILSTIVTFMAIHTGLCWHCWRCSQVAGQAWKQISWCQVRQSLWLKFLHVSCKPWTYFIDAWQARWCRRFVVCPKADAIYPIVSAASIVAKVIVRTHNVARLVTTDRYACFTLHVFVLRLNVPLVDSRWQGTEGCGILLSRRKLLQAAKITAQATLEVSTWCRRCMAWELWPVFCLAYCQNAMCCLLV